VLRADPLNKTTLEVLKFVPLTVSVNEPEPVVTHDGEILLSVGLGLFTVNKLLVPSSEPVVFVAVRVKVPPGESVTLCEESTPAVKAAVVPLPEVNVPVEEMLAVPLKAFGPLRQILLLASRAVILIVKGRSLF
jgi:hypothetical protein